MKSTNVIWHNTSIIREDRIKLTGCKNKVLWFTGLSGCGKSTIANELSKKLHEKGILTYILDGDNIRHGLNKNLGFSAEEPVPANSPLPTISANLIGQDDACPSMPQISPPAQIGPETVPV